MSELTFIGKFAVGYAYRVNAFKGSVFAIYVKFGIANAVERSLKRMCDLSGPQEVNNIKTKIER